MSIQSQFTPEQIQALVAGEKVSFSKSGGKEVTSAIKKEEKEGLPAESFSPKISVPINEKVSVTRPVIKDQSGKRISPDQVVSMTDRAWSRLEEDRAEAKKALEAQQAVQELQTVASPANLLNQLNGLRRIVEKQAKEIDKLKKSNG